MGSTIRVSWGRCVMGGQARGLRHGDDGVVGIGGVIAILFQYCRLLTSSSNVTLLRSSKPAGGGYSGGYAAAAGAYGAGGYVDPYAGYGYGGAAADPYAAGAYAYGSAAAYGSVSDSRVYEAAQGLPTVWSYAFAVGMVVF